MPKNPSKAEVNNFVGGLVTEAPELAYPPNASPDIVNFELNRDGSIRRRLGMDFEPLHVEFTPPEEANQIYVPTPEVFKWTNAAGISDFTVLVIQFDNSLVFYNVEISTLSRDGYLGKVVLVDFPKDTAYSLSAVDGRLVVVAGIEKVAVVSYKQAAFSVTYGKLRTRDLWGIECTLPGTERYESDPLFRSNYNLAHTQHLYNLQNQSWGVPKADRNTGTMFSPIFLYAGTIGWVPSNSEQVWAGLQYKPDSAGNPTEGYYPQMSKDLYGTSSSAAKGFFIIDVINRGKSRYDAVIENNSRHSAGNLSYSPPNLTDYSKGGATTLVEFAGRVFYSGFNGEIVGGDARSPNLINYIFFSQLVKSTADIFKCYQQGDPTSRDDSDIVDSDGGFIRISGAENIVGMVPLGASLVIIASNGVWTLKGGSDYGFSATNYRVDKVSSFGCISKNSIVEEKGKVFFWGEEGVYAVAPDQFGELVSENITSGRIDTFYKDIPFEYREVSFGVYDNIGGRVRWLYPGAESTTNELILDASLGCFYRYNIKYPSSDIRIVGAFSTTPFNRAVKTELVYVSDVPVMSNLDEVAVESSNAIPSLTSVKYLVRNGNKFSFAYYRNDTFKDWDSIEGQDAFAFCTTGAITANDSSILKQVQFLTVHFDNKAAARDETYVISQGCQSRVKWDWASDSRSNKWSALRSIYRNAKPTNTWNFNVVTTRNMIRGQGRAFSVYFESEPLKDCHIIGWNLAIDGNSKV